MSGLFEPANYGGYDSLFFGTYSLNNNKNALDAFVAKFDKNGNIQWATQSKYISKRDMPIASGFITSTDKTGNIYLAANFRDTITIGPDTLKSIVFAPYLVKISPTGSVLWSRQGSFPQGDTGWATVNYVSTDIKGNSYIAGIFFGPAVTFGQDTIYGNKNGNSFLVKYNTNGDVVWSKASIAKSNYGGATSWGDALDKFGNIYITGLVYDTVYFGKDTLVGNNNNTFFLAKYDSNGNVRWARQSQEPSVYCSAAGTNATCDQFGNIFVTGLFQDTIILGNKTLRRNFTWAQASDIFVVMYDSSGKLHWALQDSSNDPGGTQPSGISSDTIGHIYVSGGGSGNGNFSVKVDDTILMTNDT
ncbi:MAG: hypothetical protein KGL95_13695, partial [Patescibacteria group bacterium]|nr:hypothetical protein [Patescibacteria group bacterium]